MTKIFVGGYNDSNNNNMSRFKQSNSIYLHFMIYVITMTRNMLNYLCVK